MDYGDRFTRTQKGVAIVNASSGDPDDALWVPGVDYVSAWRRAAEAADALNAASVRCGLEGVRALPHTGARGEPVVWLSTGGAHAIAHGLTLWGGAWRLE